MEIRLHGRSGQGGVTCAKILASLYARLGKSVQTFGDYAAERSGAPIRAYTRVSDAPITNRNKVYRPDHVLVLDPTLLGADVLAGLAEGGVLLLNTSEPVSSYAGKYEQFCFATVDATAIARRHKIGTRSVVIVNTTIAGAFAKVLGLPLELLEQVYRDLGLFSNFAASREAYEQVVWREAQGQTRRFPPKFEATLPALPPVLPLAEHKEGPPTGLPTGAWRSQAPRYRERLAPCSAFCPAGNDVVGFIQSLARNGAPSASAILGRTTPLAATCGRVCPAPCMDSCNRAEVDGAVQIRGLERWIADHVPVAVKNVVRAEHPRKFAVVGGGPAGLSAAYTLIRAGHRVTLFEGEASLGGVCRTGIPSYRLPRDVLDREIDGIVKLGVELRLGKFLSPSAIESLGKSFDAVILGLGLSKLTELDVPGRSLHGIEQGIRFLHRVNLEGGVQFSGHVVVLGGGNTAMDCARSALRCGAARVTVAYRRTEAEMPAIASEIEEARHEGIGFLFLKQPLRFLGDPKVEAIEFAEVVLLGEADSSGRRKPIVTDRRSQLDCENVLLALGQSADFTLMPPGWEKNGNRVFVNGKSLPVFVAGDFATGEGTVTHALGSGRRAAIEALQGVAPSFEIFERPDRSLAVPLIDIRVDHFARTEVAREVVLPAAESIRNFSEVNRGLPDAPAIIIEAHRCFSCGHCTLCDTCLVYCPDGIIKRREGGAGGDSGYEVDYAYCKGCGICAAECPRSAIEMVGPK